MIVTSMALGGIECTPRPHAPYVPPSLESTAVAPPPAEGPLAPPVGEPVADDPSIPPAPTALDEEAPAPDDPPLAHPEATPAYRYARLDRVACLAELTRRRVPHVQVSEARGVLIPIRFAGPLHGVTFRGIVPAKQRATSPYEIVDCRLALAMDDFSQLLEQHHIVEVVHFSMYRPPSSRGWPAGKIGSRHSGALALDAGLFRKSDGSTLSVEKDFHGRIGAKTCGPKTGPSPATPEALELRDIICTTGAKHTFNLELTPNFNKPHYNHFHLEVTANVKWFIVH